MKIGDLPETVKAHMKMILAVNWIGYLGIEPNNNTENEWIDESVSSNYKGLLMSL